MIDENDQAGQVSQIDFHYQKAPAYHTIHVDGAYGGNTARGYLALTFYSERATIPRRGVRDVITNDSGETTLGPERIAEGLKGIMRQLEVTVMLDINASRELLTFLQTQILEQEKLLGILSAGETQNG